MDRATMIAVKGLGADRIKKTVRSGQGQMPAFDNRLFRRTTSTR